MPKTVTIPLETPIAGHKGLVKQIVLREPRAGELFEIGEPTSFVRRPDGGLQIAEHIDRIRRYVDACLVTDEPLDVTAQTSLRDAMALKEAMLGFFQAAQAGLPPQPTSLSSTSNSSPSENAAS